MQAPVELFVEVRGPAQLFEIGRILVADYQIRVAPGLSARGALDPHLAQAMG